MANAVEFKTVASSGRILKANFCRWRHDRLEGVTQHVALPRLGVRL